jgi:serine/threonine protein kinase
VLIANNNIIKLADFGLAKVTENPSLLKTNTNNGIVGTIR